MEVTTINNQRETSTNNKTKLTSLTLLHQLYVKSTNSHTTSILSTFLSSTCLLNQPPEYKLFERRKQNRDKKKRNWFGRKGRGGIPIIIPKTEGSQMTKVMRKDSENTSSLMIFIQQITYFSQNLLSVQFHIISQKFENSPAFPRGPGSYLFIVSCHEIFIAHQCFTLSPSAVLG